MAETTFDKFFWRHSSANSGNHYSSTVIDPGPSADILPTLEDDGVLLDGRTTGHSRQMFLLKILDDTPVSNITLSDGDGLFTTNKASGILIGTLNASFQSKYRTNVIYWDANIANGQASFDYTTGSKSHMTQIAFSSTAGDVAYGGTHSDATYTIRNYADTEDVLVSSDVKITNDIYSTYFEGTNLDDFFSVATPSGFGLDVAHEERRRMWVLGYNVRNV